MRELIGITVALIISFLAYHRGYDVGMKEAQINLRFVVGESCEDVEVLDIRTWEEVIKDRNEER